MLELYTAGTPNGKKPPILLAELEVPWRLHRLDLKKNEQKEASYLAINPNGKIPALVDVRDDGSKVTIFESGAVLQYLADTHGRFLPSRDKAEARFEVLSWLYWQVGGPGPFFGQLGAFGRETPRNEKAYEKFRDESKRLTSVLNGRLEGRAFIAGDYSIADIANYPWFDALASTHADVVEEAPHVRAWLDRMRARPAVAKGMALEGAQ